jgi:phenylpyruvate tautomerase PptA (4-oxalocrotonate tautomerase family)
MAHDSNTTTNAATSEQEMAALVAKVTTLSKLALDMTRLCIDVNGEFPFSVFVALR